MRRRLEITMRAEKKEGRGGEGRGGGNRMMRRRKWAQGIEDHGMYEDKNVAPLGHDLHDLSESN